MMVLNQNLAHIENSSSLTDSVDKSRDMSRGHFATNRKLLTNCRSPSIGGQFKKRNREVTFF